eukprot:g6273.t1
MVRRLPIRRPPLSTATREAIFTRSRYIRKTEFIRILTNAMASITSNAGKASAPTATAGAKTASTSRKPDDEVREQDRFLPIANISRIMKKSLPPNAKIAKDAKETVQECVSEFISFITSEASDKCQREKRKTINGDDLLWAMSTLGFDKYYDPLKVYLTKYRESIKGKDSDDKKKGRD